ARRLVGLFALYVSCRIQQTLLRVKNGSVHRHNFHTLDLTNIVFVLFPTSCSLTLKTNRDGSTLVLVHEGFRAPVLHHLLLSSIPLQQSSSASAVDDLFPLPSLV